jgi:hypothetical protein
VLKESVKRGLKMDKAKHKRQCHKPSGGELSEDCYASQQYSESEDRCVGEQDSASEADMTVKIQVDYEVWDIGYVECACGCGMEAHQVYKGVFIPNVNPMTHYRKYIESEREKLLDEG